MLNGVGTQMTNSKLGVISTYNVFGFSFKSVLGRINKHKKGLAAEIAWHMTWSQGTVQDQTLISKETSWHIKHIIHNNKMVDCWGVSGQNVANSSQNKSSASSGAQTWRFSQHGQTIGARMLTHKYQPLICRKDKQNQALICFFLPLVLIAVSILAASVSGLKSIAGTTVGCLGSLAWGSKAH